MTRPKFPTPKRKKPRGQRPPPRGKPFPSGADARRKPGGRPRIPPDIKALLLAGNERALRVVWRHMDSKDEKISLTAALGWLKKTVPDAERLEVSAAGGAAASAADVRAQLEAKLAKLLGDAGPTVEGELVPPKDALVGPS